MATLKELYEQGHKLCQRKTTGKTVDIRPESCIYNVVLNAFDAICDDWEPVVEKKKKKSVTLRRHTYIDDDGDIYQSNWTSHGNCNGDRILKTEEKIVEWEE